MNELIIKLSGKIETSNFDEWSKELIGSIQKINTNLVTDLDFSSATEDVKYFKNAEKSLKETKDLVISQSSDIQKLFVALDAITEEARQTRLSLERQIKRRKLEIKESFIDSAIERMNKYLSTKNEVIQLIDHTSYINRKIYEDAIKGRAGIKGIEIAIGKLCANLEEEISKQEHELIIRKSSLETLPSKYRLLFQDYKTLLSLPVKEYDLTVEKRIALYNENKATKDAKRANKNLKLIEDEELNPLKSQTQTSQKTIVKKQYRLVMDILSTKEEAIKLAQSIRKEYSGNTSVAEIRLTKNYD